MVTILLWCMVAYFVLYSIIIKTHNTQSALLFKVFPFISAFYIGLSLYNPHELYIPLVFLGIGIFFIVKGLIVNASKNFLSKIVFNVIPIFSGIVLVLKCLRDINLI